ncbi:37094_t:CDS:2, partial [Racocetra persica]
MQRKELAEKRRKKEEFEEEIREEVCVEVQDLGEDSELDREEEDKEVVDYKNERICEQLLTISLMRKKEEKKPRIIKGLPKTTYYRKFGSSGTLTNAAKGTCKIMSFFGNINDLTATLMDDVSSVTIYEKMAPLVNEALSVTV